MRTFSLLFAATLLSACGGISDSTELSTLDSDQLTSLCEEYSEERTITCTDGDSEITVELGGSECDISGATIPEACTATAGDYRACYGAYDDLSDDEVCEAGGVPDACEPLFTKLFSEECLSAQ